MPSPAANSAPTQPSPAKPSIARILGRALLGALAGFFLLPIAVFILVLILNAMNAVCGTPGDSGGCEMGLFTVTIASAIPGAAIGFVFNLVREWRKRR